MATTLNNALSTQERLFRARDAASRTAQLSTAEKNSLLENMARLENRAPVSDEVTKLVGVTEISNEDAARIFPGYLEQVERLTKHVDTWTDAR